MKYPPPKKDEIQWSVVIPYYNEEDYLPNTLESLKRQSVGKFKLILVNNGSTDGSLEICRKHLDGRERIETIYLDEANPGQVHALETGIKAADTEFVAICDADTYYPRDYLQTASDIFKKSSPAVVAVMAASVTGDGNSIGGQLQRLKTYLVAQVFRGQLHTGGYAHAFRTDVLKLAGGYSKDLWPYVIKDHEMMHRVFKFGRAKYSFNHWCQASDRRSDRTNVRWTLFERILYHVTPYAMKDWFFYTFLTKRFEARQMNELKLRDRSWDANAEN